ncbi:MAG: PorP/SprF family type IX secretion system membrane protein, partial [Bacteroidota bacterium]
MRQLYTFLIIIGFAQFAAAQQYPLFTNFITNKYGFNPAINMDTAGVCANLVFRKQWTGIDLAPQTMIAGVRGRVKPFPIGAGGYFFTDQAGVLKRTGAYGMFNFVQTLSKDTRISVGASVGFYTFRLDDSYKPPTDDFDQLVPSALDGKQFADFNAGIYLEHKGLYAGFSVPQVLERQFDFTDLAEKSILLRHYYIMAGYRHKLNDKIWVEPTVLVKYFETAPLQVDGGMKITFDKFWIGGTYRKDDAMTAMAGVNWDNFGLGYA